MEAPHVGHLSASRVPHSSQNLRLAGLAVPQFEQIKWDRAYS
jgi:hypothetical protein